MGGFQLGITSWLLDATAYLLLKIVPLRMPSTECQPMSESSHLKGPWSDWIEVHSVPHSNLITS